MVEEHEEVCSNSDPVKCSLTSATRLGPVTNIVAILRIDDVMDTIWEPRGSLPLPCWSSVTGGPALHGPGASWETACPA
eukprot:scaffold7258_cov383-Prasinococcus_capsulatus_cf.AAC.2